MGIDEKFTIEGDKAKELNETAVEAQKDYTMYYIVGGIVLVILLLILMFWLGRRSQNILLLVSLSIVKTLK